ncbi:probable serine/threonine-protein kinase kinX [Sinocyclocheilus anshuiensis]|uniref:probable serine/threonine-protein kinase kinX n=1 Tax=Sinocyclocheilus anshuiensis TaxID=1608454 RepID=UPI0007B8D20A|nr:PREDICTED: probable serine/threonine-protein kinase kinX [Sinocyclocheilus anshuiensis]
MGLCSHNGLLVMLLFHLCQAQDDALPSPGPKSAPPSLGDVIDAVKAAFEQAVQISTTGTVREALEQVVGELSPQKTPEEQSPVVETAVDYTTEVAAKEEAVVLTAGKPDAHLLESSEQTFEEPAQEGLTQDIEPAEEIQGLIPQDESTISEPDEKSVIKPGELVLEAVNSVQEPVESVLQDLEIVEVGEAMTEESHADESPVQKYPDTQKEKQSERVAAEMQVVEDEDVEEPEQGFIEKEAQLSEMEEKTAKGEIEKVDVMISRGQVKLQGQQEEESVERQDTEWDKESEHSQEEWQAVTAQMGPDGCVVDMDEVEQEEGEQEVAKTEEGVIEVEARREEVEAGSEAQLQKVSREEEVHPTDKTVLEKTQQEPEVTVYTRGPIKLQEPVITKSKATGGKTHEASDVNEIITSRDPNKNNQGVPVLMNTVEELPPTPVLKLGDTGAPVEEHVDSTQSKAIGQEAWKIGAIAAAFFLILQTAVTIVYILKCRRKPNSVASKNLCAGGNGGIECDANNTDTTIPIDEQTAVDDLLEYSDVQQEDVAMTTIPLDSTEKNSSYDPRTSVV